MFFRVATGEPNSHTVSVVVCGLNEERNAIGIHCLGISEFDGSLNRAFSVGFKTIYIHTKVPLKVAHLVQKHLKECEYNFFLGKKLFPRQ